MSGRPRRTAGPAKKSPRTLRCVDDISTIAVVALIVMVAFGWVLHLQGEEPGEFVLFGSMLLGLGLASIGLSGLISWLWYGTTLATLGFYVIRWTRSAPTMRLRQTTRRRGRDQG